MSNRGAWHERPNDDTEPRVQQLVIGLYAERCIGSQDLADAGFCVLKIKFMNELNKNNFLFAITCSIVVVAISFALYAYTNWREFKTSYDCSFNSDNYSAETIGGGFSKFSGSARDKFLIQCALYKNVWEVWEKVIPLNSRSLLN